MSESEDLYSNMATMTMPGFEEHFHFQNYMEEDKESEFFPYLKKRN